MVARLVVGAAAAAGALFLSTATVIGMPTLVLGAMAGAVVAGLLPAMGWWAVGAAGVAGLGVGVQVVWFDSPGVAVRSLLGLLLGLMLGVGLVGLGLRLGRMGRWALAVVLMAAVLLARVATVVAGDPNSGRLDMPGLPSLMTGEWGRALAVVAVGLALTGAERVHRAAAFGAVTGRRAWAWVLLLVAPVVLVTTVMVLMGDLGPAVLLSTTLAVMIWRALGARLALPVLVVAGVAVLMIGISSAEWDTRWAEVQDPRGLQEGSDQPVRQLAMALRSMGLTGLVGGGPGSGSLTRVVPVGQSDYAIATIGGDYGLLLAWLGVLVMLGLGVAILRASVRTPGERGLIATGAGWMLTITTAWVAAGTFGLVPFTGVNAPLLAMSGSAAGATGVLLGAAGAALAGREPAAEPSLPAGRVTLIATVVAVLAMVGVLGQGMWLTLTGGGGRLAGESVMRPRGDLLYADGTLLATSNDRGARVYTDEALPQLAGGYDRSSLTQSGLEQVAAGAATCGGHRGWLGRAVTFGIADACDPRDVVTTIDPGIQAQVEKLVADRPAASLLVLDRTTRGVAALAAGGVSDWNADDGQPDVGSVVTDQSPTGSVFKMVTAGAAVTHGLGDIPALGSAVQLPGGGQLHNQWDGPCPETGVRGMLAYSCNTAAAWVGLHVGADGLQQAADRLGFGHATLVGPADPTLGPDPITWPRQGLATTGLGVTENATGAAVARTAIGQQGVQASTLEIANLLATVMEGQNRQPTMVAGWCADGRLQEWASPTHAIDGLDLAPIRQGLERAAARGTVRTLARLGVIAGKTGTAETDRGNISWTVVATGRYVIVARVLPTAANPRPRTGHGGAVDVVAELPPMTASTPSGGVCGER